jgi:hypothetical protein
MAELGDKYTPSQKNIDVDDFFGGRGVLEEIPQLFQDTTLCDVVNSSGLCGSEHAMRRGAIDAHASWEEHERTLKCNPQPQIPILEARQVFVKVPCPINCASTHEVPVHRSEIPIDERL